MMYVPNSRLTRFHNRSPWLMLPRSFNAIGYDSTLICAELKCEEPTKIRIVETGLVIRGPPGKGAGRSVFEPLLAFREIFRRHPSVVIISPMRSSLVSFLPLVYLYRHVSPGSTQGQTRFILKADLDLDGTGLNRLFHLLSNAILALSSRVLDLVSVETSCGVEKVQSLPGTIARKIVRIPIGFPQGLIKARRYEDSAREPVILCVARIARMKGQDVLLRAFATLAPRYPTWSVRLVGPIEDTVFHKELLDFLVRESLERRVSFLGFVEEDEVDREYHRASIFCLPSVHSESAGQVKFEATACGLPVVTTDVPCGRDAVKMGWLVARAGDSSSLATQLEVLMHDEEARRATVERAQSLQVSYNDVASSYIQELDRLGSRLPRDPRLRRGRSNGRSVLK